MMEQKKSYDILGKKRKTRGSRSKLRERARRFPKKKKNGPGVKRTFWAKLWGKIPKKGGQCVEKKKPGTQNDLHPVNRSNDRRRAVGKKLGLVKGLGKKGKKNKKKKRPKIGKRKSTAKTSNKSHSERWLEREKKEGRNSWLPMGGKLSTGKKLAKTSGTLHKIQKRKICLERSKVSTQRKKRL